MKVQRIKLCWITGLFLTTSLLQGGLVAPMSLLDLENAADAIVVGSVTNTTQLGSIINFNIQVARVVKGDTSLAGLPLPVSWTLPGGLLGANGTSASSTPPAETGLWFLERSSSRGWLLLPVMQGGIPLNNTFFPNASGAIPSAYAYSSTASLSDKVASELSAAIENAQNDSNLPLHNLHYGILDALNSPVISLLYQHLSASDSVQQQILGLSGLIRAGNSLALKTASASTAQYEAYPIQYGVLLWSIQELFRASDVGSISILGTTADAPTQNLALREAAAHALAAIHTAKALPYLVVLLDDPNQPLRAEAIGGLGAFANGMATQTSAAGPSLAHMQLGGNAPYRTKETIANFAQGKQTVAQNEAAYLSFWKAWWLEQRTSLGY